MVRKYGLFVILAIVCLLVFTTSCDFNQKDASLEEKAVELNGTKVVLEVGDEYNLQATYTEFGVEKIDDLSWTINDNSIATVENGKVKALALGEAIVKVFLSSDESVNAIIYVSVKKASTFTFDLDGGSCGVNLNNLYVKGEENALPIPTKTGYTFVGWYLNGKKVTTLAYQAGREVSLVAKWTINKYKITFTDGVATQNYEYGDTTVAPADPTKTGYDFLGWYEGDIEYTFGNAIDADASLTAKWEIKHYTVSFDLDTVSDQTVDYGTKASKPEDPTKEGYNFLGWYKGETLFDFNTLIAEDTDLSAKFEIKKYTVTFDVEGVDDQTVEHFAKVTKPADPTRTGYDFLGWYLASDEYDFDTEVSGDLDLHAEWEIKHFTVTFDVDGYADQTVDYGNKATCPLEDPTKTGYDFICWLNGESAYDFNSAVTSDLDLTAKFEIKKYTITFDVAGIEDQTVEHFAKVTKPLDPTDLSHDFKGWMNGTEEYDFDSEVTGPLNLTAKWEIKHYTITFDVEGYDDQIVDWGNCATCPETDPVKEGHTFHGWLNGIVEFDFGAPITMDYNLSADFEIHKFDVTFTDGIATQTDIPYGSKATKPADPEKEGYVFVGWFVDDEAYDFDTPVKSDLSIESKWALIITVGVEDEYNISHFAITIYVNSVFADGNEYYYFNNTIYELGVDNIYGTIDEADAIAVNGDIIYNFTTKSILQVLKVEG